LRASTLFALTAAVLEAMTLAEDLETAPRCAAHARRWDWREAVGPAHVARYRELVARRRATPARS